MSWGSRIRGPVVGPLLVVVLLAPACSARPGDGPGADGADVGGDRDASGGADVGGDRDASGGADVVEAAGPGGVDAAPGVDALSGAQRDLADAAGARIGAGALGGFVGERQVGCLSGAVAGVFSDERIAEFGLDALEPVSGAEGDDSSALGGLYGLSGAEESDLVRRALGCADWRSVLEGVLASRGMEPSRAGCLAAEASEGALVSLVMQSLVGESHLGLGVTDGEMVVMLMEACAGLDAVLVDALVLDSGVSRAGAVCVVEGLPDWVLAELAGLGVGEVPEDAGGEIARLEQRCLSADELAWLEQAAAGPEVPDAPRSPQDLAVVATEEVGSQGGVVETATVTVSVPPGALDSPAQVTVIEPIGEFGSEVGGEVVELDHQGAVAAPVSVSWDVSHLSAHQQELILLVRWDGESSDWLPHDAAYEVRDGVLTAHIDHWSWFSVLVPNPFSVGRKIVDTVTDTVSRVVDTVADTGASVGKWLTDLEARARDFSNLAQTFQELIGRRVDAPKCSDGALPTWVRQASSPEEALGVRDFPVRLCYEKGPRDTVRMRVANNRTYGQFIDSEPDERYEHYSLDGFGLSLSWLLQRAAHELLSSTDRVYIPPLKAGWMDIGPPADASSSLTRFESYFNLGTILIDILMFVFNTMGLPPLGRALERLKSLIDVLFGCVAAVTGHLFTPISAGTSGILERTQGAFGVLVSCAKDLSNPNSSAGKTLQSALAKLSLNDRFKGTFNRLVARFAKKVKLLKIAEAAATSMTSP